MREKVLYFVVTFHTTADAMAMEKLCKKKNIPGKLISAPRAISADCGIAWRSGPEQENAIRLAVEEVGLDVQNFHEIHL